MATLEFEVFTIFPQAISAFVEAGLMGKAIERELVAVHCSDLRAFTHDRHRSVDDAPFGGGAGMVMKPGPVVEALEAVQAERGPMYRILLTPSGRRFDQRVAEQLARHDRIALLCGRYEGIDDRVREHYVDDCLSIGDFVLNGGEVAAAVIIEAVARLREGVLGNPESIAHESFAAPKEIAVEGEGHDARWQPGLVLEHPQYTRPARFRDHAVPELLLAGNHDAVGAWRRRSACLRTHALRPELRPDYRLAPDHPIVLASSVESLDEANARELVELARSFDAQLVLVGPGRAPVGISKMRDLKQVQRDLRKRSGRDPWLIGVGRAAPGQPALEPRVLLDVLAYERQAEPAPLILWLGGPDDPAIAKRRPLAWIALADLGHEADAAIPPQRLALALTLIDISQPQAAPDGVASLARATLMAMEAGGLLRSRAKRQEISP